MIAIEKATEDDRRERNYSTTSEEVGNTDGESESLPHDPTLHRYGDETSAHYERIYKKRDPSIEKVTSTGSDSWESSSRKDAIIPEICINDAEEKHESNTNRILRK